MVGQVEMSAIRHLDLSGGSVQVELLRRLAFPVIVETICSTGTSAIAEHYNRTSTVEHKKRTSEVEHNNRSSAVEHKKRTSEVEHNNKTSALEEEEAKSMSVGDSMVDAKWMVVRTVDGTVARSQSTTLREGNDLPASEGTFAMIDQWLDVFQRVYKKQGGLSWDEENGPLTPNILRFAKNHCALGQLESLVLTQCHKITEFDVLTLLLGPGSHSLQLLDVRDCFNVVMPENVVDQWQR